VKSARLVEARRWELLDLPIPEPTPGKMLVHLQRTAICGTDKPAWIGLGATYPMEPGRSGHEGMGKVIACPSGRYAEGERVLLYGFDRGLFQEYTLASDNGGCIRLPADGDPDVLLMSQLFGTVLHAFYKLGNIIGQDVVVIGQGSVGQMFNAALRNLGARRIIGVDLLAHRRALASKMGATHSLEPGEGLREQVLAITGGQLPHMVVEAVGLEATFHTAADLVRRGGTILYFGVPNKEEGRGVMSLNFLKMFSNEARIVTTVGPNPHADYAAALQWITEGRIDVRPMISHVLPHEEIQQAFEMVFEDPAASESLKVLLHF
jgi:threonine dehydrogenase-like Zn-dependent dehydrogenase